jgi:hypothetical protein
LPLASAAGVKTSCARSPAPITSPALTALPLSVSVPAAGNESMRTLASVCPASASLKPKSAAAKLRVVSSASVMVASAPAGGLLLPTLTVTVAVLAAPDESAIV